MTQLRTIFHRYTSALWCAALVAVLAGCAANSTNADPPRAPAGSPAPLREDPLRIGDRVRVELSGIPDTIQPQEQDIKDDGSINLPYINRIQAAGKSPSQLEKEITAAYVPAFYTHIGITVTPMARYFYVLGQVNNNMGGRIMYNGPITVLGAIGAAGDFTPFADKRHVKLIRGNGEIKTINCVKAIAHPELDLPVYPGDKIQVGRRF